MEMLGTLECVHEFSSDACSQPSALEQVRRHGKKNRGTCLQGVSFLHGVCQKRKVLPLGDFRCMYLERASGAETAVEPAQHAACCHMLQRALMNACVIVSVNWPVC
jgi:hypothetical protein